MTDKKPLQGKELEDFIDWLDMNIEAISKLKVTVTDK